jgi:hypothetical protein
MFFYWAYGLEIVSELEFPEMYPYAVKKPDLEIKFGKVPAMLTGPEVIAKEKFFISPTEYLIHLPICSYYVKEGASITIELKENADLPSVRLFLLTNAMAAVLHQRSKVALHAGAIQTDKGLVVICGESGAGKSTTISALQQKGYKIFVDDVLVLERAGAKVVGVAAYPTLKLWDDTIEKLALGVIPEEQKLRESVNKYRVSFQEDFTTRTTPLYKIFYLRKEEAKNSIEITKKDGLEAFKILYSQLYRTSMINNTKSQAILFERLNQAVNQTNLIEVARPLDGNSIDEIVQTIETEIQ